MTTNTMMIRDQLPSLPQLMEAAEMVVKSGIFGARYKTAAEVVAVQLVGREIGLTPMQSVRELYVVHGQVSTSAKVMVAQFERGGRQWLRITEANPTEVCGIVHLADGTEEQHSLTRAECDKARWSMDWDSEKKQWRTKHTWEGMPQIMLEWAWKRTAIRTYDSSSLLASIIFEGEETLPADATDARALLALKREQARMLQDQIAALEERAAALSIEPQGEVIDGEVRDVTDEQPATPQPPVNGKPPPPWYTVPATRDEFLTRACEKYGLTFPIVEFIVGNPPRYETMLEAKEAIELYVTEQAAPAQEPMPI